VTATARTTTTRACNHRQGHYRDTNRQRRCIECRQPIKDADQ
jgi:hypothetical protein